MDYFLCFLPWFSFFFFSPNFLTFFMGTTNRFQEPRFRALGRGGGGGGGGTKVSLGRGYALLQKKPSLPPGLRKET